MTELMKRFYPTIFPTATNDAIQKMFTEVEQLFKQPIKQVFPYPVDIIKYYSEADKKVVKLTFEIALAGIKKNEIKVQLKKGNILCISIERENPDAVNDGLEAIYVSKSISYRDGEISFKLLSDIDLNNFKPVFKDGLLTIDLYFKEVTEEDALDIEIQ